MNPDNLANNLLSLMLALSQVQPRHLIPQKFCESIAQLLPGTTIQFYSPDTHPPAGVFPVATSQQNFGYVFILGRHLSKETLDSLKNAAYLLAIILENREREELLVEANQPLQEAVKKRTGQLEQSNELLRREIEERHRIEAVLNETNQQINEQSTKLLSQNEELADTNQQLQDTIDLLSESEKRFFNLFNSSPDSLVVARFSDGVCFLGNDSFLSHSEITHEMLHSEKILLRNLFLIPEEFKRAMQSLKKRGSISGFEFSFAACSGLSFPAVISITPVEIDRNKCLIISISDISERKRLETDLRNAISTIKVNEERLRLAIEAANEGLWDTDIPTGKTYYNPRYMEILGYLPDEFEFTQFQFESLIHPDDYKPLKSKMDLLLDIGQSYENEFRMRAKDGSYRWIMSRGRIIAWDKNGRPTRVAGTHTDITERKEASLALERNQQWLQAIVDNVKDGLFICDSNGFILSVNPSGCEISGYSLAELEKKNILDFIPLEFENEVKSIITDHFSPNRKEGEADVVLNNNRSLSLEYHSVPNFLPGLHLFIIRDVTDRRKAEETLRQSELWLKSLIENTDDFIWSVDPQFQAVIFNQATSTAMQSAGLEPMITGHTVIDSRLPDEMKTTWQNAYQRALNGERFSTVLPGISSRFSWVEYTFNPVFTADGTRLGVSVFGHDISEKNRMIQSLRESEARYLTLVQNLPGTMVVLYDTNLEIILAEGQIIKQLGMKPERLVGNQISNALMNRIDHLQQACHQALNGDAVRFEINEGDYSLLFLVVPVLDSNDKIICGLLMLQDITLLKQAQWDLKNERDILQRYLDVAGVMLGVMDMSGFVRMINRKGCLILDYENIEDLIGKNWSEICVLPPGVTTPLELLDHPVTGWYAKFDYVEVMVRTQTGPERLIAFHNTLLKDENGVPSGILFSGEDITERRSAEDNLQNQYQLSLFLSKATDIKEILDICLQTALRISGMECGGIYLIEKTGDLRLAAFTNLSDDFVNAFGLIEYGNRREHLLRDGKSIYIEADQVGPFQFPPDEIFQSLAVIPIIHQAQLTACINIASRRNPKILPDVPRALEAIAAQLGGVITRSLAEEALRESEQQLDNFFNVNLDLLCIANFNGYFVKLNKFWETILGYSSDELLGQPFINLIHPEDKETTIEKLSHLREGLEILDFINRYRCKDGSYRYFEWKAHAHGDFIYAAARDITERIQMETALENERNLLSLRVAERTAELQALNVELARASKAKDTFVASMNHELRTPLTGILGLTEALQGEVYGPLTEKQQRSLHTIEESGQHLLDLINDILDLSRIEANRLELELSLVPVRQVSDASIRFVAETAHKKNITIHFQFSPDVIAVWADERRLRQMLINLLSNSVKFTPEGGSIGLDVTGDPENRSISFSVWDTGIGIKSEDLPRLFKPFVQLDSSLARQYSGTGLGLTLVLHMAQMHQGGITLQSQPGQGCRFTITLPWNKEAQVIQRDSGAFYTSSPHSRFAGDKILVIEDNETTANQIRQILTEAGLSFIHTLNGDQALSLEPQLLPRLAVINPNNISNTEQQLISQIRTSTRFGAIPIIALSSLVFPGQGIACLQAGASLYLSFPLSAEKLISTIDTLLETS